MKNPSLTSAFQKLHQFGRRKYTGSDRVWFAPPGSYYSPLPDRVEVKNRGAQLFAKDVELGPSIRLRINEQKKLLAELATFYVDFDWPEKVTSGRRFYLANAFFKIGDAIILHAMLRRFRPKQVIEVGSGFSSALMLDTNDRFLDGSVHFTFIDPNPKRVRSILTGEDIACVDLLETPVQQIMPSVFSSLGQNDILFIDSSHVAKIGSDVNYLLFEILPRLESGVLIHIHDIMWPFEYPLEWVMEGRAWNEAYMVRAFLQYNETFDILLFNSYLGHTCRNMLSERMPRLLENTGGSLWLQKR